MLLLLASLLVPLAAVGASPLCQFSLPGGDVTYDLSDFRGVTLVGPKIDAKIDELSTIHVSLCGNLTRPCTDVLTKVNISGYVMQYFQGGPRPSADDEFCWEMLAQWGGGESVPTAQPLPTAGKNGGGGGMNSSSKSRQGLTLYHARKGDAHLACKQVVTVIHVICDPEASTLPQNATMVQEVLKMWTQDRGCSHCSGGKHDECYDMSAAATTFGTADPARGVGLTHTTKHVPKSSSSCGSATVQSGHLTFNPPLLYGNFSVSARWFPGTKANVSTATGFIGLDADGNVASITMGFHGDGWLGGHGEGAHKYQHGIYADVKKSHNREYTETDTSLDQFNTFGLLWSPQRVVWSFNGRV
eukprot:g6290.t1